jgi:hypothetical protein
MQRDDLMELLKNTFPGLWLSTSEKWDGSKGFIWASAEDDRYFSLNEDRDIDKFLTEEGWYASFYDAGTVFIYPNDY